jgi:hypothetical protein
VKRISVTLVILMSELLTPIEIAMAFEKTTYETGSDLNSSAVSPKTSWKKTKW